MYRKLGALLTPLWLRYCLCFQVINKLYYILLDFSIVRYDRWTKNRYYVHVHGNEKFRTYFNKIFKKIKSLFLRKL